MSANSRNAQQLARRLFQLSVVDGAVSPERVAGVLAYVEKHKPANPILVLRAYHRLVGIEIAKGRAIVEHAGEVAGSSLQEIAAALSRRYHRTVTATARPNPALIAGLRVRVGDDIYESSVAGQLSTLRSAG
jgi:F-type H+-transporting ATPase subunit delta